MRWRDRLEGERGDWMRSGKGEGSTGSRGKVEQCHRWHKGAGTGGQSERLRLGDELVFLGSALNNRMMRRWVKGSPCCSLNPLNTRLYLEFVPRNLLGPLCPVCLLSKAYLRGHVGAAIAQLPGTRSLCSSFPSDSYLCCCMWFCLCVIFIVHFSLLHRSFPKASDLHFSYWFVSYTYNSAST